MTPNIESLPDQMTLEEQVGLLAGADFWTAVPVPRLGIPAIKVSDGPNGARGGVFQDGPTTACFPVGIALSSVLPDDVISLAPAAKASARKLRAADAAQKM